MYARHKLNEAKFFFGLLSKYQPRSEEYAYCFSAFLNSFRSITFAIQSDYRHCRNFDTEYKKLLDELSTDPFAREMVEARNINEKEGTKIPILIITNTNPVTGDSIKIETDPLARDSKGVCRFSIIRGINSDLPTHSSKEEMIKALPQEIANLLERSKSDFTTETATLRILPDGTEISHEEFSTKMLKFLDVLEKYVLDYEEKWLRLVPFGSIPLAES